jgi:hypothetical protein
VENKGEEERKKMSFCAVEIYGKAKLQRMIS